MGGLNSYLIGCCTSSNNCPENHCKLRISQSNRSFTFNKINDNDFQEPHVNSLSKNISTGVININEAPEDILMTLPGVNRNIAHDIIVLRNEIGRFKNIEDIALVNGMGAAKFKLFKSEISTESYKTIENSEILINEFDIFQLTKIPSFNQTLAERIVRYRNKNGPFKSLKDLMRVQGINKKILESIKPFVKLSKTNGVPSNEGIITNNFDVISNDISGKSNESVINFTTNPDTYFNFILGVWYIENEIDNDTKSMIGKIHFEDKPTILILLDYNNNRISIESIHKELNNINGVEYFSLVKCNVGDNCVHNNETGKLKSISNFPHYCRSISLHSLSEDILTCMTLTIQIENNIINCVAVFRCLNKDSINVKEELILLNELASKLQSDDENSFVFLCDTSLIKSVYDVFENFGFDVKMECCYSNDDNKCFVTEIHKKTSILPKKPFQLKQLKPHPINNIIQHNFDILIPLC